MLNKKARKTSNNSAPTLRTNRGETIELEPIEKGSVVPLNDTRVETRTRKAAPVRKTVERPGAKTKAPAHSELFDIIDDVGFCEVLKMMAHYAECERANVPTSDQPLRVYWRKFQTLTYECGERLENLEVKRG